jgi:two-component system, LytTR family, sensor kinase
MTHSRNGWSAWTAQSLVVILGFWTIVALLSAGTTLAARARSGATISITESIAEAAIACAVFALLTPLTLEAARRWPLTRESSAPLTLHVALALLYWGTSSSILAGMTRVMNPGNAITLADVLTSSAFGSLLAYAVTVGVSQFINTGVRLGQEERQRTELALELSQAKFHALTGQLRPHFIFNALNAVATLIPRDPAAAEQLVIELSKLLRMSLDRNGDAEVALADEVAFIKAYLSVMSARIGDRLRVTWAVPDDLLTASVPQLLVLPLVENALKHGIGGMPDAGGVSIAAASDGSNLQISVVDDGPGPPAEVVEGFGLSTTRARLMRHFGPNYTLELARNQPRGAKATVNLPMRRI